jgi:hypothetical protein
MATETDVKSVNNRGVCSEDLPHKFQCSTGSLGIMACFIVVQDVAYCISCCHCLELAHGVSRLSES